MSLNLLLDLFPVHWLTLVLHHCIVVLLSKSKLKIHITTESVPSIYHPQKHISLRSILISSCHILNHPSSHSLQGTTLKLYAFHVYPIQAIYPAEVRITWTEYSYSVPSPWSLWESAGTVLIQMLHQRKIKYDASNLNVRNLSLSM